MDVINRRSQYLTILVTTLNRVDLLRRTVDAIRTSTRCDYEIIVVDGGSTDGTREYLESNPDLTAVYQTERMGQPRALNEVWKQVDSRFTAFLSDDQEPAPGIFDLSVRTLEADPAVGMINLKMKDTLGPYVDQPWRHSICRYGILTCQVAVMPMALLRAIGYANEDYKYWWNNDLTAAVLCAGHKVLFTKKVGIWHHREWALTQSVASKIKAETTRTDAKTVYRRRFGFLSESTSRSARIRHVLFGGLRRLIFPGERREPEISKPAERHLWALAETRFISLLDPIVNLGSPFYLVQQIPRELLTHRRNPYCDLIDG